MRHAAEIIIRRVGDGISDVAVRSAAIAVVHRTDKNLLPAPPLLFRRPPEFPFPFPFPGRDESRCHYYSHPGCLGFSGRSACPTSASAAPVLGNGRRRSVGMPSLRSPILLRRTVLLPFALPPLLRRRLRRRCPCPWLWPCECCPGWFWVWRRCALGLRLHGSLRLRGRGRVQFCCHSCTSWCISAVTIFLFGASVPCLQTKRQECRHPCWGPEWSSRNEDARHPHTGMLAWQRAFNGLERIVCSQQRISCWR